ncbi:hypothetical protein DKM44_11645 [Deinococcus irradiatisoli]|uniref:DUF4352 domain-containing protein n=1 Tax=Deinococcus irradiatisoli TaxID=2202254 RepID=A0A2Z3JQX2_9DEIO|nr:hypothetical protein [Deinococcus irradiatisoli]AWN23798.1 hypothetical protein DKM44_11645 [Deinococcus irradiatisoli]
MTKTSLWLAALSLTSSLASAQTLILDGKVSTEKTIVVGGKTYVPLSVLPGLGIQVSTGSGVTSLISGKAAPASSAPPAANNGAGGANQKASVSGCLNEWLFNGVWRLRVTKVQPMLNSGRGDRPAWGVTVEVKNGTGQTLTMSQNGIDYNNAINLSFPDGSSMGSASRSAWQDKVYTKLPQGVGTVHQFVIDPDDSLTMAQLQANPPSKFLFEVQKKVDSGAKGVGFTVPDPSFRIDLTCKR